jgi:ATP-binding cassette subfamily B protein
VGFTYEGKQSPAVQHVNFVLHKGEILGITGPTGSGKSTLAHFIMRQYAPSKGSITFDTIDVNRMRRAAYSQAIAYVPQDVFLFSDTIYENIAFGAPNEVSAADVERAAAMACLLPDIQGFPAAMNTMLGERGVTLSGGQKQRLSLARALLRKADLYVLDDCLSAVDLETEKQIIANLKATLNGNTAIIISHRVAPLSFANEILVLDQGVIVEHGSMSALLHAKGAFAGLYERQAGEFGIPS